MKSKTIEIINDLAKKVVHLRPPIHVIAVCSGGRTVGKQIYKYLKSKKIESDYYEVWMHIIDGKASIWKSSFKKTDYKGTALIAEDVIWQGRSVNATKRMLQGMNRKKTYVAVILDYNHKADFSIFH